MSNIEFYQNCVPDPRNIFNANKSAVLDRNVQNTRKSYNIHKCNKFKPNDPLII